MKFCSNCSAEVVQKVPEGDNALRYVCESCGTIHYQNPRMVVGCVPEHQGRILLCKRAIETRLGYWTVPAGFMENGETLEAAAMRETDEEAMAKVELGPLFAVVNVTHAHQVHFMFKARLTDGSFGAGHETLEACLCREDEIPWDEIAFPSVDFALKKYFEDRAAGVDGLHLTTVPRVRLR